MEDSFKLLVLADFLIPNRQRAADVHVKVLSVIPGGTAGETNGGFNSSQTRSREQDSVLDERLPLGNCRWDVNLKTAKCLLIFPHHDSLKTRLFATYGTTNSPYSRMG